MRVTELSKGQGLVAPLVLVAIMDESPSQIEIKQERLGLKPVGVTLPRVVCATLAQSLGFRGADIDNEETLLEALEGAWASRIPTLIGVHLSPASSRQFFEVLRG